MSTSTSTVQTRRPFRLPTRSGGFCLLTSLWMWAGCAAHPERPPSSAALTQTVSCGEAYGAGQSTNCRVVTCDARYASFLGTWEGPFEAYVRELSTPTQPKYRPYLNRVSYETNDCLENVENHDTFIIGRRTDVYPAFDKLPAQTRNGLLITGRHVDGTPFLRTVDAEGVYDYALESQQPDTETSVWTLGLPASQYPCPSDSDPKKLCATPEMAFRLVDGRDVSKHPDNVRRVTVEMQVGPSTSPYWKGVIARGEHAKQAAVASPAAP